MEEDAPDTDPDIIMDIDPPEEIRSEEITEVLPRERARRAAGGQPRVGPQPPIAPSPLSNDRIRRSGLKSWLKVLGLSALPVLFYSDCDYAPRWNGFNWQELERTTAQGCAALSSSVEAHYFSLVDFARNLNLFTEKGEDTEIIPLDPKPVDLSSPLQRISQPPSRLPDYSPAPAVAAGEADRPLETLVKRPDQTETRGTSTADRVVGEGLVNRHRNRQPASRKDSGSDGRTGTERAENRTEYRGQKYSSSDDGPKIQRYSTRDLHSLLIDHDSNPQTPKISVGELVERYQRLKREGDGTEAGEREVELKPLFFYVEMAVDMQSPQLLKSIFAYIIQNKAPQFKEATTRSYEDACALAVEDFQTVVGSLRVSRKEFDRVIYGNRDSGVNSGGVNSGGLNNAVKGCGQLLAEAYGLVYPMPANTRLNLRLVSQAPEQGESGGQR